MTLRILPLPTHTATAPTNINPLLPPGSALLVAPSNSGKTCWMVNALTRKSFGISREYKYIFVFSPTLGMDASWNVVRDLKPKKGAATFHLDPEFSTDKIEQILDFQESLADKDRHKVLIVCDDCADLLKDNKTLARLFFRGRHARVWCWLSVQSFRAVPRNIRLNSPYFVFWKVTANELRVITEEVGVEEPAEFRRIFKEATDPKYGFLTIDAKASYDQRYSASFCKNLTHS